jgi:DNA-binding NarL/FixJ family response regulator
MGRVREHEGMAGCRTLQETPCWPKGMLRQRWLNALRLHGVVTVEQLRAMSEEQLLEITNLGRKSVADIAAVLADPALCSEDPLERLEPPRTGLISERNREVLRMKESGSSLAAIARRFEISSTRVRQILDRHGTS